MATRYFKYMSVTIGLMIIGIFLLTPVAQAGDKLVIGHTYPITGTTAESGLEIVRGSKTAVAEVNEAGGINGIPLDYVVMDDQLEKVQAVNNFRKLAGMKNVFAVGASSTGTGIACRTVAERHKVIQINGSSLGTWPKGLGEWVYRTTMPDAVTVPALLKAIKEKYGVKTIGMMWDYKDDWSGLCKPIYAKAVKDLGLTAPIEPQSFGRGDSDFSAQLTKLKSANVDAIFMPVQVREGSLVVKQARGLGIKAIFCGTSGYISITGLSAAGDAADGVLGVTVFHPSSKRPGSVRFYKKFKELYPKEKVGSYLEPTWYDAVALAAEAARRANIKPPVTEEDRIKVRDEFGKIKGWVGASGTFTYDGPGDPAPRDMTLIRFNAKTKEFDVVE